MPCARPVVTVLAVVGIVLLEACASGSSGTAAAGTEIAPETGACAPTEGLSTADGIFVMNADGTAVTRLTQCNDEYPAWSPDGTSIAFASASAERGAEDYEIYVLAGGASQASRLTNAPGFSSQAPDWSRDGQRIAFHSDREGNDEIYVMNADGTGVSRLTTHAASDREPSWSPDGSRIAFTSDRDGNDEIYVMNADGSGVTRLTDAAAADGEPRWSPDGTRIGFFSGRDGNDEIYVINADGTGIARLTTDPAPDFGPAWSPDGTRIAFERLQDEDVAGDVFVMNADGSGVTNVTNNPRVDGYPNLAWSPDGTKIAFNVH